MPLYNSFYGGRRGTPFILKKSYPTIGEMCEAFSDPSNQEVGFDEYVLISNENRTYADNGKIFRRGYDYNSTEPLEAVQEQQQSHGAIYVGTIIGSPAQAPKIKMDSYEHVINENWIKQQGDLQDYSHENSLTITNGSVVVPGKTENTEETDIKYSLVTVRDKDYKDYTVYVGFKIPYLVTEFTAQHVDPYQPGNAITQVIGGTDHPFYNKWHLTIPKGKPGKSLENLRIKKYNSLTANEKSNLYEVGGINPININNTSLFTADDEIIYYKAIDYENSSSGDVKYYFLGKYNQINNVELSEDGTLTFTLTNSTKTFSKVLRSISTISFDSEESKRLKITYNTGEPPVYIALPYVASISLNAATGALTYKKAGSDDNYPIGNIKYVNNVTEISTNVDNKKGGLSFSLNDGSSLDIFIKNIEKIGLVTIPDIEQYSLTNNDINKVFVGYKNKTADLLTDKPFYTIQTFNFDNTNGALTIKKSTDNAATTYSLKYPTEISYDMATAAFKYKLIGTNQTMQISGSIPLLKKIQVGANKYLYAQFNLKGTGQDVRDAISNYQVFNVYDTAHQKSPGDDSTWINIGFVGQTTPPLAAKNLTYGQLKQAMSQLSPQPDDGIDYVNYDEDTDFDQLVTIVSNSLTYLYGPESEIVTSGKVITIGDSSNQKDFYAYGTIDDNTQARWYYLGRIQDSKISVGGSGDVESGVLLKTVNDICTIDYTNIDSSVTCANKISSIQKGSVYKNRFSLLNIPTGAGAYYRFDGGNWVSISFNTEISIPVTGNSLEFDIQL